jgi:hypothetical protein
MLNDRSIKKIGNHLEREGWTDEEIEEALNSINVGKGVVNVALPLHFKEEALQHAKCHCAYVLKLKKGTPKYKQEFKEAYNTYLIEAYENSKGVEGPSHSSVKAANPAGIELHAFDKVGKEIISSDRKVKVSKSPVGLIYIGKDGYLQRRIQQSYDTLAKIMGEAAAKRIIVEFVTQYSASVTSLSNTFLFIFGGYQTKRKFSGVKIYEQDDTGHLVDGASKPMEFDKKDKAEKEEIKKGEPEDITLAKKLLNQKTDDKENSFQEVAYRQMTRQIYIYTLSSIIAGAMALDSGQIEHIENGIKRTVKDIWDKNNDPRTEPSLKFLLTRDLRNQVMEKFSSQFNKQITELNPKNKNGWSTRQLFLEEIYKALELWEKG